MLGTVIENRDQVYDAYDQCGGTPGGYYAGLFKTHAQAFYAGQVTALDNILEEVGMASVTIRSMMERDIELNGWAEYKK